MKNFKMLSKAEMKKVMGGTLNPGDPCMVGIDICPMGYSCINGYCLNGEGLTCDIVAKDTPGCGNSAVMIFPPGTTLNQAYDWCANQTCCDNITC